MKKVVNYLNINMKKVVNYLNINMKKVVNCLNVTRRYNLTIFLTDTQTTDTKYQS